jgi:hypothetical protein
MDPRPDRPVERRGRARPVEGPAHPERCPRCEGRLVYPVDWRELRRRFWASLRCPECEWGAEVYLDAAAVRRYAALLDQGTDRLRRTVRVIGRHNARRWVDAFASALEADAILPEDFIP